MIVVTSGWQTQSWYPQLREMSIKNPLLLPSVPNLLIGPNKQSHQLTKLATPSMDNSREKLSAEGLSEESAITNARRPGTVSHYELA